MILLTRDEAVVVVQDLLTQQGGMVAMFAGQSAAQVKQWYSLGLRLAVDERLPLGNMLVQARQRAGVPA